MVVVLGVSNFLYSEKAEDSASTGRDTAFSVLAAYLPSSV